MLSGRNDISLKVGFDVQKFQAEISKINSSLSAFGRDFRAMAGTIDIAFGTQQVASFALEVTKLAGVADGVRQAFNKLEGSARVLQELTAATRGTVSELELMKAAVQANNFSIPIQQLGQLFQFAYERAKATGQSVDYLVNSIVIGIGRKSPLILDNLGISAVALKEKLKGISSETATIGDVAKAVGQIASEELEKMGTSAVTSAEKLATIGATWENIKELIGKGLGEYIASDDPNALLTNFQNQLIVWQSDQVGFWEKLMSSATEYAEIVKRLTLLQNQIPLGPPQAKNPLFAPLPGFKDPNAEKKVKELGMRAQSLAATAGRTYSTDLTSDLMGSIAGKIPEYNVGVVELGNSFQKATEHLNQLATTADWEQLRSNMDLAAQQQEQLSMRIAAVGNAIGHALGQGIAHAEDFASVMARVAKNVVASLEQIAIAHVIKNAAALGPFGLALAGAGIGVVRALFDSIGTGGGSSGSSRGYNSRTADAYVMETQIKGQDLAVMLRRYQQQSSFSKG